MAKDKPSTINRYKLYVRFLKSGILTLEFLKSMKFAFQLANLAKPNSSKNTIVFCLFEAKDSRNNLRTALVNYEQQLKHLKQEKVL